MSKFIVLYNGEPLKTYELFEPVITIGRLPENTISIANMGVSRRHARIEEDADHHYMLTDLNSLNATFVNGKRAKKVKLANGDKITIGKYTIIYEESVQENGIHSEQPIETLPVQSTTASASDTALGHVQADNSSTRQASTGNTTFQPAIAEIAAESTSDEENGAVLIETTKHVVYKLDSTYMTIGNGDTDDVFVTGFMMTRGHVTIEKTDEGFVLSAQKMVGKIKVNGRNVRRQILKHKDRIEIGSSTFRYMENG